MNRREFLRLAGAPAACTLIVHANPAVQQRPSPPQTSLGNFDTIAPPESPRRRLPGEPHLQLVDLEPDVCIAGGGMSGVCAALAAARNGARVVLVQDRSRLGGNASSEVKMHIVGADCHGGRPGWREGGLIEELRLDDAVHNPHRSFELWDLLLYDKIVREPNILLLLDTTLFAASTRRNRIRQVLARCDKTEHLYRVTAPLFVDCTGDCRLALEAGAEMRVGREAQSEFDEPLAVTEADRQTLGSSVLFTARDYGRPIPFTPPPWARKITREQLQFRGVSSWEYGYWWIEWGGQIDSIRDNDRIRFELLAIVLGVWDYIKNSGNHPSSANWGMDWIGMVPGKRESRRIVGDYLLTQHDLLGKHGDFADAVAIGGWPFDDHPPEGFDRWKEPPFRSIKIAQPYNIPLRSLYSRNIVNLFMAGRNLSASHVALSSTRVMATCSALGQAVGTAAALCARHNLIPRSLYQDKTRLRELQQTLLRDDQTILGLHPQDGADLAPQASISASSAHGLTRAANVTNGRLRDLPGEWKNRWAAELENGEAWLELTWTSPQTLRQVQITFDTGFHRELTLSASDHVSKNMVRGPQPETVRNYELLATLADGSQRVLAKVAANHQRLRRHAFDAVQTKALRLRITATHGSPLALVYEVRAYS